MGDFLKSQRLWHITTGAPGSMWPVEAVAGAPTLAEALLQAAWDENLEQVQGIIVRTSGNFTSFHSQQLSSG